MSLHRHTNQLRHHLPLAFLTWTTDILPFNPASSSALILSSLHPLSSAIIPSSLPFIFLMLSGFYSVIFSVPCPPSSKTIDHSNRPVTNYLHLTIHRLKLLVDASILPCIGRHGWNRGTSNAKTDAENQEPMYDILQHHTSPHLARTRGDGLYHITKSETAWLSA